MLSLIVLQCWWSLYSKCYQASDLSQQLESACELNSDLWDTVQEVTCYVDFSGEKTLTLSLLIKLPLRKLEGWLVLWSFFLLRLLCISINHTYSHACNTVVMAGLMLLVATWNCYISYKNGFAGQLVVYLLRLSNI